MTRWPRRIAVVWLLCAAAGCATTNGDPRDPAEGFNRAMYSFNDSFDSAIGKPVATAYRDFLPGPVRSGVRNFFANIADLWIGANNLLQAKPADAITDWARFAFNSTIGLFGLIDVASAIGIDKHDEDFGQTLGRWGLDDGAYLVWPFLGSSSVRDTAGLVPDLYVDPVLRHRPKGVRGFMTVTRAIGRRADLLDASRILEEAALDKYVFQRDAYLQRRRSQVHDGNPPRAARQAPSAELAPAVAPAVAPASAPTRAPLDAAVRLLEAPAAAATSSTSLGG
ncbi:MAG: MlaA family lipoprotein [Dongiaceae bacterium]